MKGFACVETSKKMDHIPAKVVCVAESMEKLIPAIKKHVADFLAPIGVDKFYTDYTLSEVEKYFSGDKTEPSSFVGVTKKPSALFKVEFSPCYFYMSIEWSVDIALTIQETNIV